LPARYLVDRVRQPRSRADDLLRLRRRFEQVPALEDADPVDVELALSMRDLRRRLHAALAGVSSCQRCARGHPPPNGHWDGGHCCGTRTDAVFTDEEVLALRLGGTRPRALRPPSGDHAGCAFRGERGCSLNPEDRPSLCVTYICNDLQKELNDGPQQLEVRALKSALDRARRLFGQRR